MRFLILLSMLLLSTVVAAQNPFDDPTAAAPQGAPQAQVAPVGGVGMALRRQDDSGLFVVEALAPGGPAAKAGVKPGDVLMRVDGQYVYDANFGDPTLHIRGTPGTDVKLTIERDAATKDFTIRRVALGQRPADPPKPADHPKPAGGIGAIGDMLNKANPQPAQGLIRPGLRITFHSGASTLAGARKVPDPNGWLTDREGNRYSLQGSQRSGGVGFLQLTVLRATPQVTAVDARNYLLVGPNLDNLTSTDGGVVIGDGDAIGDAWLSPARLAALADGRNADFPASKGAYTVNGHRYNALSVRHHGQEGYSSNTYDLDTGILLFGGRCDQDPEIAVAGPDGQTVIPGNTTMSHSNLAGVRQTQLPWADAPTPDWVCRAHQLDFSGTTWSFPAGTENLGTLPGQRATWSVTFDKDLGGGVFSTQQALRFDLSAGLPADAKNVGRCYGAAQVGGLWLSAQAIAAMKPGTVVDEDPAVHVRTTFVGVRDGVAVVTEAGPGETTEYAYDRNGALVRLTINRTPPSGLNSKTVFQAAGQR